MQKTISKYLNYFLIIFSSVVFISFCDIDKGWYYPLISLMCLASILMILKFKSLKPENYLFILFGLSLCLQNLLHPESFRESSVFYSFIYIFSYLYYLMTLNSGYVKLEGLRKLIRIIIIAYAVVLLYQQVEVLVGVKDVFNLHSDLKTEFKLNSLSWESSYLAVIIPILFYTYIRLDDIKNQTRYSLKIIFKRNRLVWILFLYITLTSGSLTTMISVPVVLCYYVNKKNIKYIPFVVLLLVFSFAFLSKNKILVTERFADLINVFHNFDPNNLVAVDASAATRILPYYNYFHSFDLFNSNTWTGYGMDAAEIQINYIIRGEYSRASDLTNLMSFFYDFGLISGIILLAAIVKNVLPKIKSFETFLFIALISAMSINNAIFWLFCMLSTSLKYYESKYVNHG